MSEYNLRSIPIGSIWRWCLTGYAESVGKKYTYAVITHHRNGYIYYKLYNYTRGNSYKSYSHFCENYIRTCFKKMKYDT